MCDAAVYFFQSENGGRVFFDEIGPPWPKHPCTDNPIARKNTVLAAPPVAARKDAPTRWRVLRHAIIRHAEGILTLQGLAHDIAGEHSFYFTGACRVDVPSAFFPTAFIDATLPKNGVWPVALMYSDRNGNLCFMDVGLYPEARTKADVDTWERALAGSAGHQNAVAWSLSFGLKDNPVSTDSGIPFRIARYWFGQCALGGEWVGHHNLGVMQLRGLGGGLDEHAAFRNLKEAARSFEPVSLRRYAEFYRKGIACVHNEEVADAIDLLASFELAGAGQSEEDEDDEQ